MRYLLCALALLPLLALGYDAGVRREVILPVRMPFFIQGADAGSDAGAADAGPGDSGVALFRFATGAVDSGMGTACACTAVTGTQGETITVTNASSGYCFKQGDTFSGIANGDVVLCGANLPRVEPTSSGTLGIRVESAGGNAVGNSQNLTGVPWTLFNGGGASPATIVADQAVAPDGTTTADRLTWASCAAGYSVIGAILGETSAGYKSSGLWVKGVSGSGSLAVQLWDNTTLAGNSTLCPYVSTSWTYCGADTSTALSFSYTTTNQYIFMGCNNNPGLTGTGGGNSGSGDAYVWQVDVHMGRPLLQRSILNPNNGAYQARAADVVTASLATRLENQFSLRSSAQVLAPATASYFGSSLLTDAGVTPARLSAVSNLGPVVVQSTQTATHTFTSDSGIGNNTLSVWYTGSVLGSKFNGVTSTNTQAFTSFGITDGGIVQVKIGQGPDEATQVNGIVYDVCFADRDSTVCQ